jgi:hypothetical protein
MGKKQQKSKAIALTFRPCLGTFSILHKWAKKSEAIAFNFRPFPATFSIFYKWEKNGKNVRL